MVSSRLACHATPGHAKSERQQAPGPERMTWDAQRPPTLQKENVNVNVMPRLSPPRRFVSAASVVGLMLAGSLLAPAAASAAEGDENAVPDAQLRACLNETVFNRAADTAISVDELSATTAWISCGTRYAGISDLEGIQHLDQVVKLDLTGNLVVGDLSPFGEMDRLRDLSIQNFINTPETIDLSQLAGAADTLRWLRVTPDVADETVPPPTTITGVGSLPNLTQLVVYAMRQTDLTGIEGLASLTELYAGYNLLDADDVENLPRNPYAVLRLDGNAVNDFSGLPTIGSSTIFSADDQRYVSDDVLLMSGDDTTLTATPVDRTVPWAGGTAELADGGADSGELTFDADHLLTPDLVNQDSVEPVHTGHDLYATYGWTVSGGGLSAVATGKTFYPVVVVDQAEATPAAVAAHTPVDLDLVTFDYSAGDRPTDYAPTSYAVTDGALPAGLQLDPTTGKVTGKTTKTGTFTVTVQTTDTAGLTTTGTHTVVVDTLVIDVPATPGTNNPAGPGNASWIVPADTATISWSLQDGHLIATTAPGAVFSTGARTVDFGLAVDPDLEPGAPDTDQPVTTISPVISVPTAEPGSNVAQPSGRLAQTGDGLAVTAAAAALGLLLAGGVALGVRRKRSVR